MIDYQPLYNFALAHRLPFNELCTAVRQAVREKPIDMVLFCPACGTQHIDAPEDPQSDRARLERHRAVNSIRNPVAKLWGNPPHRSHQCGACQHVWRPADVPTNGVAKVKTRGKEDSLTETFPRAAPSVPNCATCAHCFKCVNLTQEMDCVHGNKYQPTAPLKLWKDR